MQRGMASLNICLNIFFLWNIKSRTRLRKMVVVFLMTETFDSRDCRLQVNTPANEITQQPTYWNVLLGSSDLSFPPAVDFELIDFDKPDKTISFCCLLSTFAFISLHQLTNWGLFTLCLTLGYLSPVLILNLTMGKGQLFPIHCIKMWDNESLLQSYYGRSKFFQRLWMFH